MSITRFLVPWRRKQSDESVTNWVKSSLSSYNGNCVEVADLANKTIQMRDSKDPHGKTLTFADPAEWAAFLIGVKNGEFDRPPA
jgi:hypothetical protein